MRGRHFDVGFAPPDRVLGFGVAHDELVFCRATGVRSGFHHQRAVFCQDTLAIYERIFDQLRRAKVAMQCSPGDDALLVERNVKWRRHGKTPVKSNIRI